MRVRRTRAVHQTIQGPEDPVVVHLDQALEAVRREVPQNQILLGHLTLQTQDRDLGEVLKEAHPQGGDKIHRNLALGYPLLPKTPKFGIIPQSFV